MFRVGRLLFVLGGVLLVACLISMPFWKNFNSGLMTAVFGILIASAALIFIGEMLRFSGKRQEKRVGLGFMDFYRMVQRKSGVGINRKYPSRGEGRRCAFCGIHLTPSSIPAKLDGVVDMSLSESHAGRCEECGKLVCPQCAFRKGMDMGLRSFRCPACGGRVA